MYWAGMNGWLSCIVVSGDKCRAVSTVSRIHISICSWHVGHLMCFLDICRVRCSCSLLEGQCILLLGTNFCAPYPPDLLNLT
jgi:hypothetical protein